MGPTAKPCVGQNHCLSHSTFVPDPKVVKELTRKFDQVEDYVEKTDLLGLLPPVSARLEVPKGEANSVSSYQGIDQTWYSLYRHEIGSILNGYCSGTVPAEKAMTAARCVSGAMRDLTRGCRYEAHTVSALEVIGVGCLVLLGKRLRALWSKSK